MKFARFLSLALTALTIFSACGNTAEPADSSVETTNLVVEEQQEVAPASPEENLELVAEIPAENAEENTQSANAPAQDADGLYVYTVDIMDHYQDSLELHTSVNIYGYLNESDGVKWVDISRMAMDLGWTPIGDGAVPHAAYDMTGDERMLYCSITDYKDEHLVLPDGNILLATFRVMSTNDNTKSYGVEVAFDVTLSEVGETYLIGSPEHPYAQYYMTLDQIAFYAYYLDLCHTNAAGDYPVEVYSRNIALIH